MPLNAATLGTALRAQILGAGCGAVNGPELTALANAIATAVVAHIVANAQVLPTALISGAPGAPVTGVGTIL